MWFFAQVGRPVQDQDCPPGRPAMAAAAKQLAGEDCGLAQRTPRLCVVASDRPGRDRLQAALSASNGETDTLHTFGPSGFGGKGQVGMVNNPASRIVATDRCHEFKQ